jgi:cAMP and cAMP-inhibited cGMP 3',5'-cyclic phosphodiesterase 10
LTYYASFFLPSATCSDQVVDSGRPFGGAGADVATKWAVQSGTTVAAFVAYTQKTLLVKRLDTGIDPRFPDGVGNSDKDADRTISVLCQPIFQSDGELIGVLELMRTCEDAKAEAAQEEIHTQEFRLQDLVFAEEDEEISSSYLVWGGIAMYYAEMYVGLRKMRNLNDFLLDVIKSLFKDISTDAVVARIMAYAKQLVDADRASLFLVDAKQEELVATVFDQGDEELSREIRFPKDKGIAGYFANNNPNKNG